MQNKRKQSILTWLILFVLPFVAYTQTPTIEADPPMSFAWLEDPNTWLVIIALLLLIPIYYLGQVYYASVKSRFPSIPNNTKTVVWLMFISGGMQAQAQTVAAPTTAGSTDYNIVTYVILLAIFIELILLVFLARQTFNILTPEEVVIPYVAHEEVSLWQSVKNRWAMMNNFKPIGEEAGIDTGHNYDGIRELDNITPPWFTAAFFASILFACVYTYQRHVSYSVPTQIEEFTTEMAEAEYQKAKYLEKQGNNVDESSVVALGGEDIIAGKAIFVQKCAVCHAENGASMPGGVGPNLTDEYWIHGGSIKNIFTTIKYGYPEKGMIAWSEQLSPLTMAQISSYIKSLHGTNLPGGKEAQGDLYKEGISTSSDTTTVAKDTTTTVRK